MRMEFSVNGQAFDKTDWFGPVYFFGTIVALVVLWALTSPAHAGCGHHRRDCRHERYRYYDGPRSDYGTRFIGENGGTVHYGN
jgi:hypothetical protein